MKILLVEDEKDLVALLGGKLRKEGHEVTGVHSGEEALEHITRKKPDMVILDLMLPGIQGLEVCRQIRANPDHADVLIIMLTAKAEEVDRIVGFEMGADDYITKPFSMRELISRVASASRRLNGRPKPPLPRAIFSYKGLHVDFEKYEFKVHGKKIALSPIETKLLFFLIKNQGRVYSRDQLLDHVWGNDVFVTPRSVDVHISRLRRLIEKDAQKPQYILTVRNVGYKFDDAES
jgi:DNA-binding response OmpR family regulator